MKNKFQLPRLNYIAFELIKIPIAEYIAQDYAPIVEETVFLAVLPEQMNYSLTSRDAVQQTNNNVFVNQFALAPEKVSLSGTFGDEPRYVGASYLSGYQRLKQFEQDIVRRSKQKPGEKRSLRSSNEKESDIYVYGLNFYDFTSGRFGSANINSFSVSRNARENTNFERYKLDFMIIGELISAESQDPLLMALSSLFGDNGIVDDGLTYVNDLLGTVDKTASWIGLGLDALSMAKNITLQSASFLSKKSLGSAQGYKNVLNLL